MRGPPERATLWPAREGLICRDPRTKSPLPATGRNVMMSPYWHRRIIDGDVVTVEPDWARKARLAEEKASRGKGGDG